MGRDLPVGVGDWGLGMALGLGLGLALALRLALRLGDFASKVSRLVEKVKRRRPYPHEKNSSWIKCVGRSHLNLRSDTQ